MGWASGGEVFDPVARKLIDLDVSMHVKVAAFREHGIVRACADEEGPDWAGWCELEIGHSGDHDDELGNTWPQAGGDHG